MKKIKPIFFFLIVYCQLSTVNCFSQDAHFSQYYASSAYLNPALTGLEPDLTFSSSFRTQWSSIIVPYNTTQMSLIYPLRSKSKGNIHYGGAGLSFYGDKAGNANFKTLGISVNFAYNLPLSSTGFQKLTFGMKVGFVQKNLDNSNLEWGEQYDPFDLDGHNENITVNEDITKVTYPDINAGIMWYHNAEKNYSYSSISAFSGISVDHINNPEQSFIDTTIASKLPLIYKYHGGLEVNIDQKISFSPNLLIMYQNQVYQINGGLYLSYRLWDIENTRAIAKNEIIFGTWYRYRDAFIFLIGINNPWYTVGLSYDLNSSSLKTNTRGRGAYEISLSLRLVKEKEMKRYATPRF
ncbi:MAG: type IX secretion system membrane protein PorP/SprF [Cytophagales bacterium]|nr:type IX secretion system membrane protein PorP/SprF [Cytophagales bacterium]